MSNDVSRLDTALSIQEWQQKHHHHDSKPEDRSVTARLCDSILDVFQEALRQLAQPHHVDTVPKPVRVGLERAQGLIVLWSDGYGIQDGRLDDVFAKSRNIRRSTLRTLSSIANTLLNRLIPLAKVSSEKLGLLTVQLTAAVDEASYIIHDVIHNECDDCSETSSDGFSDAGPDDSIAEVAEDLRTDAQCLMDLDPLFRDPVLDLASHKQKQHLEAIDWTPETIFCDKVQQRFPKATTTLVERLGKANWARFLRCQEQRHSTETASLTQTNAAVDKGEEGTVAASSKYHDSGLGTSLPTASSYAETVMTYGAGSGQKVRIPPLSDEAKQGTPFPCLACGRSVRITNNSSWKLHLYQDLKPYLCLEPQCAELGFSTRVDWVAHLALDHGYHPFWDAIACPLCFETTERGNQAVTTHLARHLEEISLSALPAYPDEDDDEAFETGSDESTDASATKSTKKEEVGPDKDGDKDKIVQCICGYQDLSLALRFLKTGDQEEKGEGLLIQCDMCKVWQHGFCNGIYSATSVPRRYYCEICRRHQHVMARDTYGKQYSAYRPTIRSVSPVQRDSKLATRESHDGKRLIRDDVGQPRMVLEEVDHISQFQSHSDDEENELLAAVGEEDGKTSFSDDEDALREVIEEEERQELFEQERDARIAALEEADLKAREIEEDQEEARREAIQAHIDEVEELNEALNEGRLLIRERREEQRLRQARLSGLDEKGPRQEAYTGMADHLYRSGAEIGFRSGDEDDEDDESDEEDETVVEDWDSRK